MYIPGPRYFAPARLTWIRKSLTVARALPPSCHNSNVYITIQYQAVMARQALHFLSDGISFSDTPSNWWSSLGRGPTTPTLDAPGVACSHLLNLLTEVTNSRSNARLVRNEIAARGSSMLPRRTSAGFLLGDELERVEIFKYLSLMLAYNGNDTQAMQVNLKKVWTCWV